MGNTANIERKENHPRHQNKRRVALDPCAVCAVWEKRGFERRLCATGECPYRHLGYIDPVECSAASVRNAVRARGIIV